MCTLSRRSRICVTRAVLSPYWRVTVTRGNPLCWTQVSITWHQERWQRNFAVRVRDCTCRRLVWLILKMTGVLEPGRSLKCFSASFGLSHMMIWRSLRNPVSGSVNVSGTHEAAWDFPVPSCKKFTNIVTSWLLNYQISTKIHNAQRHFKYNVKNLY